MKELYKTITTTRRHKELGYCEKGDFGSITLLSLTDAEAPLICTIKKGSVNQSLRLFKGYYYTDYDKWNSKLIFKEKQGRLTERTTIKLMVKLREDEEKTQSFFSVSNQEFILIGRRIYKRYCKKSNLSITQTGNMIFNSWWCVDVEPTHQNKLNKIFNKKNFEKELKEAREYYNKKRSKKGNNLSGYWDDSFSYPKIKWFNPDLIKNTKKK